MDIRFDNAGVRRQDRLLDECRAEEILRCGEYGFLALGSARGGYGVPLNYVAYKDRIYFHCAPEGEKLRRIAENSEACFCVVGHTAPQPAQFTTEYESVMTFGKVTVVHDDAERMHALSLLIEKYSPDHVDTGRKYAEKSFGRTCILRMDISRSSGKCKKITAPAAGK